MKILQMLFCYQFQCLQIDLCWYCGLESKTLALAHSTEISCDVENKYCVLHPSERLSYALTYTMVLISLYIIQSITSPQLWKFSQLGKNGHVLRQHYDLNFVVLEGWVDGDFSWDSAKWFTAQMVKPWFLFRKTAVRVKR